MLRIAFTILLLTFSMNLIAQNKEKDIQLTMETIENYFDGYINRDSQKLNAAFDIENGTMKTPFDSEEGKESFQNKYFKDIIPMWSAREQLTSEIKNNCSLEILSLDIIEGKLAIGKIEMKIDQATYIDVLSLQKLNNQWKITNKMYLTKEDN